MRRYGWAVTAWLAGAALWASVGVSETWKSEAVIYGITPYHFAEHQPLPAFRAIEARIPELAELGVNVLWLQPVYVPATPGHGYDVVDFKKVWPELGTEAELRSLIHTAHQWDMKVLFDIPVNHTPPSHPYARDVIARGKDSPYYDFYMHELKPGVPYSEHLKIIELGGDSLCLLFLGAPD